VTPLGATPRGPKARNETEELLFPRKRLSVPRTGDAYRVTRDGFQATDGRLSMTRSDAGGVASAEPGTPGDRRRIPGDSRGSFGG
jgi:hypothetical protein